MNKNKKSRLIGAGAIFTTIAIMGGTLISKKIKNYKNQEMLKREQFITGRVRRVGTFYLDGIKQRRPLNSVEVDGIKEFSGEKIDIRNTDKEEINKLSWVEINDENKKILICDRNILKGISWNDLNDQGLVFGKVVIIDGKKYILRLMTGCNEKKDIMNNEWDKYITNVEDILSLPSSSEEDKNEKIDNTNKLNGDNNSLWNWCECCSITQSSDSKSDKNCILRGFYATTYSHQANKECTSETVGYRPILEVIE